MQSSNLATITWLGQAGFILEIGDLVLLLDPYLSDSLAKKYRGKLFEHKRLMHSPFKLSEIPKCDFYLCSHSHTDHMDPETIESVQQSSSPDFLFPRHEIGVAEERGIDTKRNRGVNAGEIIKLSDVVSVMAIPAAHEALVVNDRNEYKCLGFVILSDGLNIYHSGDCVPYEGQADLLRSLDVNVALLPVNGRDSYRTDNGVPGNFYDYEAIALCEAAGIKTLVPHHWGMFDFNTIDPYASRALSSATSVNVVIPSIGEPFVMGYRGVVAA